MQKEVSQLFHVPTCLCLNDSYLQEFLRLRIDKFLECKTCKNFYHSQCVGLYSINEKICPKCQLCTSDPLHQPISVVLDAQIIQKDKEYKFFINQEQYQQICSNDNFGIEIRCYNLTDPNACQRWPDTGKIKLNNHQKEIFTFWPLNSNSSQKERKDPKIFISPRYPEFLNKIHEGINNIIFESYQFDYTIRKQYKINDFKAFVFTILFVQKTNPFDLIDQIKQNYSIQPKKGKSFIITTICQNKIVKNSELEIEKKLYFRATCPIDKQLLELPARGIHCKHIECFSLKNFIVLNYMALERNWICQICKKRASQLYIDQFAEQLLKQSDGYNLRIKVNEVTKEVEFEKITQENFVKENESNNSDTEKETKLKQDQECIIINDNSFKQKSIQQQVGKENKLQNNNYNNNKNQVKIYCSKNNYKIKQRSQSSSYHDLEILIEDDSNM